MVKLRLGVRSVKAQERNLEPVDTRLEILAETAMEDTSYQRMLLHTENNTPLGEIEKDSELFMMGSERQYLSTFTCSNGCKLLIKNAEEVVIPQCSREEILNELHATHMCAEGMKRLARGKFTWKNMGKDIERKYSQCEMCLENSRSKPNIPGKRNEVVPSSLELACAG